MIAANVHESPRHRTAYLEAGPADGPLMVFVHGWPELGLIWRAQIERFAALGWRCVAPDMRGYGGSSVPSETDAYAVRELVADMVELHDALGGDPAVWVGHDWGSAVVWSLAAHHPNRCRGVVSLCVPYFARGFALPNLLPLVDRTVYPEDRFPAGQWDYFLFYRERFDQAVQEFDADVSATVAALYRRGDPGAVGKPGLTSGVRANGGWFGPAGRAPAAPRDASMLSQDDFDALVAAFRRTGFRGACAWYLNDEANLADAAGAYDGGRLSMPVLFLHAAWDTTLDTAHSRLAAPMRQSCADLTEVTIEAGHELQLERPDEVNAAIESWIDDSLTNRP